MSLLWNIGLFKKLSKEEAECNECKRIIKMNGGSTSGLKVHLNQHPEYKNKLIENKEKVKPLEKFISIGGSGNFFKLLKIQS